MAKFQVSAREQPIGPDTTLCNQSVQIITSGLSHTRQAVSAEISELIAWKQNCQTIRSMSSIKEFLHQFWFSTGKISLSGNLIYSHDVIMRIIINTITIAFSCEGGGQRTQEGAVERYWGKGAAEPAERQLSNVALRELWRNSGSWITHGASWVSGTLP